MAKQSDWPGPKPFNPAAAGFGTGTPGTCSLTAVRAGSRFKFMEGGSVWVGHGNGEYGTGPKGSTVSHPSLGPAVLVLVVGSAD